MGRVGEYSKRREKKKKSETDLSYGGRGRGWRVGELRESGGRETE